MAPQSWSSAAWGESPRASTTKSTVRSSGASPTSRSAKSSSSSSAAAAAPSGACFLLLLLFIYFARKHYIKEFTRRCGPGSAVFALHYR